MKQSAYDLAKRRRGRLKARRERKASCVAVAGSDKGIRVVKKRFSRIYHLVAAVIFLWQESKKLRMLSFNESIKISDGWLSHQDGLNSSVLLFKPLFFIFLNVIREMKTACDLTR